MDAPTTHELARLLATLIGEIMEDHVDAALAPPGGHVEAEPLRQAGDDIAILAKAITVVERHAGP